MGRGWCTQHKIENNTLFIGCFASVGAKNLSPATVSVEKAMKSGVGGDDVDADAALF